MNSLSQEFTWWWFSIVKWSVSPSLQRFVATELTCWIVDVGVELSVTCAGTCWFVGEFWQNGIKLIRRNPRIQSNLKRLKFKLDAYPGKNSTHCLADGSRNGLGEGARKVLISHHGDSTRRAKNSRHFHGINYSFGALVSHKLIDQRRDKIHFLQIINLHSARSNFIIYK